LNTPILLFLLSPFIGLIQGFKHHREAWAKNSIWLFVIFYGFTMYRPVEMDANRYVEKLGFLYDAPLSWDSFLLNFYSDDGSTVDIYQPLITYLMALFTKNGNLLFAVFGFVFGYFYSRNIWLLFEVAKKRRMDSTLWILIFTFASIVGYWELNGVRMWTAAHIFFYGTFLFIIQGKKKGFLIAASSVLVHFSFVLPVSILIFYHFIKVPWKWLYFIFIASFFVSELNVHVIGDFLGNVAPEFLVPKVKGYTNDEYIETLSTDAPIANWYVRYYLKAVAWVIFIMTSSIYFSSLATVKSNKAFSKFFGFTLLFLSIGNLMSLIPSGGRYLTIARIFAMALLFLFYVWYDNKYYRKYLSFLSPLLVFFIIVSIRISFETTTFVTVLANPIIAVFVDVPIALISIFK
jgi:hypothetical protein